MTMGLIERLTLAFGQSQHPQLTRCLLEQFTHALEGSEISMLPVCAINTTGTGTSSSGKHLCIELGGSTLRVGLVDFDNGADSRLVQESWLLDERSKVLDAMWFDELVTRCETSIGVKTASVCIIWSFPVDPEHRIITMGKGWSLDPKIAHLTLDQLVVDAFASRGYDVSVRRVVNDGTAVAITGAAYDSQVSLILGTGVNVCLLRQGMLYNVELGFFGSLETATEYDLMMDARFATMKGAYVLNETPLFQPFEVLTSGRYLGELLRIIWIQELCQLECPFATLELTGEEFCKKLYGEEGVLKDIAMLILQRSAYYVRSALLASIEWCQGSNVVCYTGSFLHHCAEYQQLITRDTDIELQYIEDSMIGGAIGL